MRIRVLGPLVVDTVDGLGPRDRVVLATLVVRGETSVPKELLADALYGEAPPPTWPKIVQGSVARLRKQLGASTIETSPYGYRLIVHDDELDSRNFERLVGRAREHLAAGDADRAAYVAVEALQLWRGRALPDVEEWEPGRVEAERLNGLRMDAQEVLVEAEIAAGRARACLEQARSLVKEAPLRELRWCLFARALYQSGRQTEALRALGRARTMLREELGLDPGTELVELEQAILCQDPHLAGAEPVSASQVCPYRGLLSYEAGDAEAFYGRDVDVAACLARLRDSGVLAVVGPSGTGKSSVVRAGVVAMLRREGLEVVVTTPGARPLDSLAALPSRHTGVVLVVDQAEELVTLCGDIDERAAYVERLVGYAGPLVLAIRADRLGDLSTDPGLARLVERGLYLLAPMGEDELRSVIEGPARNAGLRLEPGLVDLLAQEVRGEPGALPLLSHVLRQTWERREGVTLTVEGYRQTGGIREAVAQSAEELYGRLGEREQLQLRSLFLRLVTPGDGAGEATRTRLSRDQLSPDVARDGLVEALVDARLVSTDDHELQIAHEALAREWPRLREWLEEDVEGQRTFRHLAAAAAAWDDLDRPDSELYRGVRLGAATEWAARHRTELTDRERAFLDASAAQADREQNAAREQLAVQRRHNRRLRVALVGIAGGLLAALVAGALAVAAQRQSQRDADAAETAAKVADSRRLGAQALVVTEPDVSLLLGVESVRRDDSLAARSTLYSVLGKAPRLFGVARGPAQLESVAMSPDGRTVAVASGVKGGLSTYDAATLEQTGIREDVGALGVGYSPDGRRLAAGLGELEDGAVNPNTASLQLLDAATLNGVATFGGLPTGSFVERALDFSADGRRLAAVAWNSEEGRPVEALVWDVVRPGTPILRVPMPGIYASAELSADGALLYLAQRTNGARVVEVDTGRVLARRPPNNTGERGQSLVLSPDGRTVATSDADGIAVLDAARLRPRYVLSGVAQGVSALAFSQDGGTLAAGYVDGSAVVWDLAERKPVETVRGHSQEVQALRFGGDGRSLYTVSWDGQLLAWDLADNLGFPPWRTFATNPNAANPHRAVPSPDGKRVAYLAYGSQQCEVRFRDLETGRLSPRQLLPIVGAPLGVWSPDSRHFLTGGEEYTPAGAGSSKVNILQLWDATSGELVRENLDAGVGEAVFIEDGEALLATTHPDVGLRVLDADTLEPEDDRLDLGSTGADYFFPWVLTPDERRVVLVGAYTKEGVVVDLAERTVTPISFPATPLAMALSPDGDRLAVVDATGAWGVLDAASLTESKQRWVVPRRQLKSNFVWYIYWSADGKQLITTASGTIDLWDAATLTRVGNLKAGAQEDVANVQPMKNGHTLVIGRPNGPVLTWDLRPDKLVDLACSLAGRNLTREEWREFVGDRPYRRTCPG